MKLGNHVIALAIVVDMTSDAASAAEGKGMAPASPEDIEAAFNVTKRRRQCLRRGPAGLPRIGCEYCSTVTYLTWCGIFTNIFVVSL